MILNFMQEWLQPSITWKYQSITLNVKGSNFRETSNQNWCDYLPELATKLRHRNP